MPRLSLIGVPPEVTRFHSNNIPSLEVSGDGKGSAKEEEQEVGRGGGVTVVTTVVVVVVTL